MKMIFVTGNTGDMICVASDNISHVDVATDKAGHKLINHCALFFRQTPNINATGIILSGTPITVGIEINKQLDPLSELRQ